MSKLRFFDSLSLSPQDNYPYPYTRLQPETNENCRKRLHLPESGNPIMKLYCLEHLPRTSVGIPYTLGFLRDNEGL